MKNMKEARNVMDWIIDWITNPYIFVPMCSWAVAQVLKMIINLCITKKLDISRLFGDGGMPSGHSATVAALATTCALHFGTGSVEFALSSVLAIIVCHDATGVRQETGKQAILIDEIIKSFDDLLKERLPEVKLKKFVGHTFLQVLAGISIGIANAFFMHCIVLH